ncbi:type I-E CRISPR-associated protein Cas6/Cse3/CasE [bacterium]|nr:type I-E CRISPR-associated protein Cas6/Cse3/CasE [bacterium]
MYFSRVLLDTNRRSTIIALASLNKLHGAIEMAFPGPRQHKIWRIDVLGGKTYLLILSQSKPELSSLFKQFGPEGESATWETKDYDPLLQRITQGSCWHFRLVANPTLSQARNNDGERKRGKVMGHITTAYQEKWLLDRAEKHGFLLNNEEFRVVKNGWLHFRKGNDKYFVSILSATYDGILTVSDVELFRETLVNGLGRGKAYGQGMLTIAKPAAW